MYMIHDLYPTLSDSCITTMAEDSSGLKLNLNLEVERKEEKQKVLISYANHNLCLKYYCK